MYQAILTIYMRRSSSVIEEDYEELEKRFIELVDLLETLNVKRLSEFLE
ncbi:MAG: hypothetical protein N3G77_07750 [Nitrososphaeria archaeon]|nr:hypothetical protein [Nitrososphaeria archaeon]